MTRPRFRLDLDRPEILVIVAALRSFTDPPTDFSDEFAERARALAEWLKAETGVAP